MSKAGVITSLGCALFFGAACGASPAGRPRAVAAPPSRMPEPGAPRFAATEGARDAVRAASTLDGPSAFATAVDEAARAAGPLAVAACEASLAGPRQPRCSIAARDAVSGLRLGARGVKGKLRWCSGDEPLPWLSSARGATVDVGYEALGIAGPVSARELRVGAAIGDTRVVLIVGGVPALVSTAGTIVPLRLTGTKEPATAIATGGIYPPTRGAVVRMPDGDEPMFRIDDDGTVTAIAPPAAGARFVGWAASGGASDTLWRWRPLAGSPEIYAVVHHAADGSLVGPAERFDAPSTCSDDDVRVEGDEPIGARFFVPARGRGQRVGMRAGGGICFDRARGREDREVWRASKDPRGGTERVTCAEWRLESSPR